ncbi:hypothetical protein [Amycolatopsis pigmentata]|uniref:Uncharacterized protein n=1 Tax=Amycolatopsis pigmentata TaxID=450801 RepID=A0ABW5FJ41_9PSEU
MPKHIRSPYDVPDQPITALAQAWSQARTRTTLSARAQMGAINPEDLFVELAYGARITQEATCGRWCAVADLLRSGAVDSWAQIATAMGLTETATTDGFRAWLTAQRDLYRETGTIGINDVDAAELLTLAEAVTW